MMKHWVKRTAGLLLSLFLLSLPVSAGNTETVWNQVNEMYRLREAGNHQECIRLADQLLQENPAFMEAYFNKAVSQYQMRQYVSALETLEKQLEWNPENELALFNAACVSALSGKSAQALRYLKKRMELNTDTKNLIQGEEDLQSLRGETEFQKLSAPSVRVGGTLLWPEVAPVNVDGRILVPMRTVFDAFGAQVAWDNATRSVTGSMGTHSVKLTIGSPVAYVNGNAYSMDVPPLIVQDRAMVPVRVVGEALGAEVRWDGTTQTADLLPGDLSGTLADCSQMPATVVLMTDGMWPESYYLKDYEGMAMLLLTRDGLQMFQRLTPHAKKQYILDGLKKYRGLLSDCDPIYVKVVCEGKAYYTGVSRKESPGEIQEFTSYQNGFPVNVIKQYRNRFNYLDYRQSNQSSSEAED